MNNKFLFMSCVVVLFAAVWADQHEFNSHPLDSHWSRFLKALFGDQRPMLYAGQRSADGRTTNAMNDNDQDNGLFEGDMKLSPQQRDYIIKSQVFKHPAYVANVNDLWPEGRVPYGFTSNINSHDVKAIHKAMARFHEVSCIKFVPKTESDTHFITIDSKKDDGCWSLVGRLSPNTTKTDPTMNLDYWGQCQRIETILHEFMHAIGFYHEQSRPDRDEYIDILWENVNPESRNQFNKYDTPAHTVSGTKYDYESIMHYSPLLFNVNDKPTMRPKKPGAVIGHHNGFSETDIYEINALYRCSNLPPLKQTKIAASDRMFDPSDPHYLW